MIYKKIKEINEKGETKKFAMYYVYVGNKKVYIKPTFTDNNKDWALLDAIADYENE